MPDGVRSAYTEILHYASYPSAPTCSHYEEHRPWSRLDLIATVARL